MPVGELKNAHILPSRQGAHSRHFHRYYETKLVCDREGQAAGRGVEVAVASLVRARLDANLKSPASPTPPWTLCLPRQMMRATHD